MLAFIGMIVLLFLLFAALLTAKESDHFAMLLLFIGGFTVYSGIGLAFYQHSIDSNTYLVDYALSVVAFLCIGVGSLNARKPHVFDNLDGFLSRHSMIADIAAIAYICTFIFVLIYERVPIDRLFDIARLFRNYTATSFTLRVSRSNDALYRLIAVQIRGLLRPFYFIYLYKRRKRTPVFLALFLLPIYCTTVANSYISRNELAVTCAFILVYLVSENKLNRHAAFLGVVAALPIIIYAFVALQNLRSYGEGISFDRIGYATRRLIEDECCFPQYYPTCNTMFSLRNTVNYFLYVFTSFIPSGIQHLIGINTVDLAHAFTESVIGLRYGDAGYYILLPSVLGEGIILFGKSLAWVYLGIYGAVVFWMLRVLKSCDHLYYMKISFMLEFLREFRGGSQYLLTSWITTIVPFIVIITVLTFMNGKGRRLGVSK